MKKILILFSVVLAILSCSNRPFSNPTDYIKYVAQVGGSGGTTTQRTVYYMLTVNVEGDGEVLFNKNKYEDQIKIEKGTKITLEAVANSGSEFYGWSGTISSKDVVLKDIVMDKDITLLASFIVPTVWKNLHVNIRKGGSVYINGFKHENKTEETVVITKTYEEGTVVILKAESNDPDVDFGGWSGAIASTEPEISITLDESKVLYASFSIERFLNIVYDNTVGYIEVSVDGKPYEKYVKEIEVEFGDVLRIKAIPLNTRTHEFAEWRGSSTSKQAEITITVGRDDVSLTAVFAQVMRTLTINNLQGKAMEYKVNGTPYTEPYVSLPIDTSVTVVLTEKYYPFTAWSGDATGNSKTLSITLDDNKVLNATFETGVFDTYDDPDMNGYNASQFDTWVLVASDFNAQEVPTYAFNSSKSWPAPSSVTVNGISYLEYKHRGADSHAVSGKTEADITSMDYYQYRGRNFYMIRDQANYSYNSGIHANRIKRFYFNRFKGSSVVVSLDNALCVVDTYTKLLFSYAVPTTWGFFGNPTKWEPIERKDTARSLEFYQYDPIGFVDKDGKVVLFKTFTALQAGAAGKKKFANYIPTTVPSTGAVSEYDISKLDENSPIRSPYY